LKKLFDLLGLKVLTSENGASLGILCDILINIQKILKIEGFIISSLDEKKQLFIPYDSIKIGNDIIFANMHTEPLLFDKSDFSQNHILKDELLGLMVYTDDGHELGMVKELILSEEDYTIEGVACSDGLFNDILNGRTIYPLIGKTKVSKKGIYISQECAQESIKREEMEV
jgi:uncharacterized protein YrrD